MVRLGLPPGTYFRLLLIGYFEGIDSERGIASRAADSFALRDFRCVSLKTPLAPRPARVHSSRHKRRAFANRLDERTPK